MLTTIDNPYNPLKDFDKWLIWDRDNEYYTPELIARLTDVSSDMTDSEIEAEIDRATQSIIDNDTLGVYMLVS